MALRLDLVVLGGELFNTKHFCTHGYLELRGREAPLRIDLAGNCGLDLAGWHIRFAANENMQARLEDVLQSDHGMPRDASEIEWLAGEQVGATGEMTVRQVKWHDCPVAEAYLRCKLDEPPPFEWKKCLYLEWYSQNGRVVLELLEPEIEFVERFELVAPAVDAHLNTSSSGDETASETGAGASEEAASAIQDLPWDDDDAPPPAGLGVTAIRLDDDCNASLDEHFFPAPGEREDDGDDSDAALFDPVSAELQRSLDDQAFQTDWKIAAGDDDNPDESMREMMLMDELIERGDGTLLSELFDGPLRLPRPDAVGEQEAEGHLKTLLAQLARYGIALDICEHYTARACYRLLVEELLPEQRAFKELQRTQWVQHFSTWEFCPACDAQMEREWEQDLAKRKASDEDGEA